ncbi:hypothetical protein MMAG44476_20177 [Mycolicibacterium mageritense DSM 44476 = CIP 104973]|uniref:DUF2834 domain-containing protein n=1 Tax=Mycolicibacterium mageritense TaxID=53462 RepID=A0ABM7HN39_MYCME|nr:DUF2834 domain-containing protein [Mycolicibacterium mageritense]MCC9183400.1 DUF2834 domain-containing protein [Mycolicibacterium mageritense]BBX31932.1 hypothetical protein MMAGJ_12140 [Mycolicibacterium mageritense]CDO23521.1 hypothetical protein BN978_04008 [Mycolicibacterium mageritense DSM 44476 = CIP 104973]
MVSLLVHAILGIAVVALIVRLNPQIFSRPPGPAFSPMEVAFYAVGIASIPLCWYFNAQFVAQYAVAGGNPIWGPGSWAEFIELGYTNPAASSASADYTIANVILLPLFSIVDGLRRGIRHPWLFFVSSLFTSFAFAFAFYFATIERQRRHQQTGVPVG